MAHELGRLLAQYGLVALFIVVFVKSVGVPIPIPIYVIVLAAATGSAGGKLVPWQAFGVLLVGMVVGGCCQYALARGPARSILYRFGRHLLLTPERLEAAFRRVRNVGVLGIAISVVTPGIRTAAIPACGLTRIPARTFVAGLTAGIAVYITVQFFVAYGLVKLLIRSWNTQPHGWLLLAIGLVVIAIVWMAGRHWTGHGRASRLDKGRSRLWICPLCIAEAYWSRLNTEDPPRPAELAKPGRPTRSRLVAEPLQSEAEGQG